MDGATLLMRNLQLPVCLGSRNLAVGMERLDHESHPGTLASSRERASRRTCQRYRGPDHTMAAQHTQPVTYRSTRSSLPGDGVRALIPYLRRRAYIQQAP